MLTLRLLLLLCHVRLLAFNSLQELQTYSRAESVRMLYCGNAALLTPDYPAIIYV